VDGRRQPIGGVEQERADPRGERAHDLHLGFGGALVVRSPGIGLEELDEVREVVERADEEVAVLAGDALKASGLAGIGHDRMLLGSVMVGE
jgi:hypothetical protein